MLGLSFFFMSNVQPFEQGLALYTALVGAEPDLARELEASRVDFGPVPADPSDRELYDRRHLEWFLFDRHCESLQGAPVEALFGRWQERARDELPEVKELESAYLESIAGVFEVTSSRAGTGVVVDDLLGLGTYEVEEREAAAELEPGDLVVGRLHPIDAGRHRFSPAAGAFRNKELLQALRGDLERMRRERRSVLRIQQNELEKLFFSSASSPVPPAPGAPGAPGATYEDGQERALEAMRAAGIAPETCGEVLSAVGDSIALGDPGLINDILDQLAFDTQVDLEELRRAFAEMADAHRRRSASNSGAGAEPPKRKVAEALHEFDRGRAAGGDLEELFATLERNLGVEGVEQGVALLDGPELGFPGVVGAVVEEFLWDVGRQQGEDAARRMEPLRLFARYANKLDVFEELGVEDLLDFCARWMLDEGGLDAAQARVLLQALESFCEWCEHQHKHPLMTEFAETLGALKETVPRLIELRASTPGDPLSPGAYRVCAVERDRALVERVAPAGDGSERVHVPVDTDFAEGLCENDLVCLTEAEPPRIGRLYPAELEGVLRALI